MTRPKILGYIVTSKDGAYHVSALEAGRPVLLLGAHVDVFPTWHKARRMVDRTVTYSDDHGLGWGTAGHYLIRPLRSSP